MAPLYLTYFLNKGNNLVVFDVHLFYDSIILNFLTFYILRVIKERTLIGRNPAGSREIQKERIKNKVKSVHSGYRD